MVCGGAGGGGRREGEQATTLLRSFSLTHKHTIATASCIIVPAVERSDPRLARAKVSALRVGARTSRSPCVVAAEGSIPYLAGNGLVTTGQDSLPGHSEAQARGERGAERRFVEPRRHWRQKKPLTTSMHDSRMDREPVTERERERERERETHVDAPPLAPQYTQCAPATRSMYLMSGGPPPMGSGRVGALSNTSDTVTLRGTALDVASV